MLVIVSVDELGAAEATFGLVIAVGAVGGAVGSPVDEMIVTRFGRRVVAAAVFVASFAVVVSTGPGQSLRQSPRSAGSLGR